MTTPALYHLLVIFFVIDALFEKRIKYRCEPCSIVWYYFASVLVEDTASQDKI